MMVTFDPITGQGDCRDGRHPTPEDFAELRAMPGFSAVEARLSRARELPSERREREEMAAVEAVRVAFAVLNDEQRRTLQQEWPLLYRAVSRL